MQEQEKRALRARLLAWYDRHRRDLPWRRTHHPYRVWVSEIMLQQTRVAAVLGHYREFLRRFPSLRRLAAARPESVLAAWSGLGYYRRARALHAAARVLVRENGGRFPRTAEAWRELPGVGRYTAAAIASIAFQEPVGVVDGNVERVLRRLLGKKRRFAGSGMWQAANALLSPSRPGDFNQAMMELGATVCLPKSPKCPQCPLARWCRTRGAGGRATPSPRQRRHVTYGLSATGAAVFLVRRPARTSLMPGMWELPEIRRRGRRARSTPIALCQSSISLRQPSISLRHSIMNTDYVVEVVGQPRARRISGGQWIARRRLGRLPLTGLARKILRHAALIE
jgi:A/G-specific adenine glycosylase